MSLENARRSMRASCRPTWSWRTWAATSCPPLILRAAAGCTSTVRDRNDPRGLRIGSLRPDGSIVGNDNDADAAALRAALHRNHQQRAGADLRGHPGRPERRRHHRPAHRRALPQRQSPAAALTNMQDRSLDTLLKSGCYVFMDRIDRMQTEAAGVRPGARRATHAMPGSSLALHACGSV